MKQMLGQEYEDFEKSFEKEFHNGIRVNTLKADAKSFFSDEEFSLKRIPWTDNGFYMGREKRFYSSHPYYHAGLYYIQEASAMVPARLMDARPGQRLLDLCAAPGGKSTELAARMRGEGLLISNDVSRSRAKALVHNIETMGFTNCVVTSAAPDKLASLLPEFFDGILIDAPCSGEGMFHKEASMMESWKRSGPDFYHDLQKEILASAAAMLAPGGRLVYSTCTFSPQEDEGSIAWFLKNYPDFHVEEIDADLLCGMPGIDRGQAKWLDLCPEGEKSVDYPDEITDQLGRTLRLWPQHLEGEGHFAAVLRKDGVRQAHPADTGRNVRGKDLDPFFRFLHEMGISFQPEAGRLRLSNGYVQYLPQGMPDLPGVHILRSGWFLGQIKKDRFEPSGAFARGLKKSRCSRVISLPSSGKDIRSYLKCQTLDVGSDLPSGWYLVCMDDWPVGWCKIGGGRFKNKYPAGWRSL